MADMNIAVIGLGYVGLPLSLLAKEKGYNVFAVDVDTRKIGLINKRVCPINDDDVRKQFQKCRLFATSDFSCVKEADIVIICVPTPVDRKHYPDLNPVKSACKCILPYLRKGHLVVVESTVNPGVCEDVVAPILEKSGLLCGTDFHLAHCPERIDPGNRSWTVRNIPRVVGSTSKIGLSRAYGFYSSIIGSPVKKMASIKEAEATKIVENTFRDINIAFVNELAKSFDRLGIDVMEVIKGASTKPFAFMPHFPGCGVGGHCIPVDPCYLIEHAKRNGFDHKFLRLARKINNSMPSYTVELLEKMSGLGSTPLKGTTVGVLGLSYKKNVADDRESPSYEIIRHLKDRMADVLVYDPFFPGKSNVDSVVSLLRRSAAVILATDHDEFMSLKPADFERFGVKILIDGRNAYDKGLFSDSPVVYKGIGTLPSRVKVTQGKAGLHADSMIMEKAEVAL
jgi:UDP-N-acetyl-D-glucosamine dehydrogenase